MTHQATAFAPDFRPLPVPEFGIGQTDGVWQYLTAEIPRFCQRLGLCQSDTDQVQTLLQQSYQESVQLMNTSLTAGMVEPTAPGRALYNLLGDNVVCPQRTTFAAGEEHLETALEFMSRGGNVLLVQNHRSGADTLLMEITLKRKYGFDIAASWTYMSGHAVNLCLIPLIFAASAIRRLQIFSVKYKSMQITGMTEEAMSQQNLRALSCLKRHAKSGGKLIAVYPEGGRGDTGMIRGQAETMAIPGIIAKSSPIGLMVLPTYVHNTTSILPVVRTINEYNMLLANLQRGWGTFSVGRPVMWQDLQFSDQQIQEAARVLEQSTVCKNSAGAQSRAAKRLLCDRVVGMVAHLAPNDQERGPYAAADLRALVTNFV